MRTPAEIADLAGEFWLYLWGRDYFRQLQPLGLYFADSRGYYLDIRGKAAWAGPLIDDVPARPKRGHGLVVSPCTVVLYGLGNLDCLHFDHDEHALAKVQAVTRWLLANVCEDGYWPEGIAHEARHQYYSANSAMNQGLALSFLVRAIRHLPDAGGPKAELDVLVRRVAQNMLAPFDRGGTLLRRGSEVYFPEMCQRDESVVYNGWAFAVFGLMDYVGLVDDNDARLALTGTLNTLALATPAYQLRNGWSRYDDLGRISSPFYHRLHIDLLEALGKLTGATVYGECRERAIAANGFLNRVRYAGLKIRDKLLD